MDIASLQRKFHVLFPYLHPYLQMSELIELYHKVYKCPVAHLPRLMLIFDEM